MKDHHIQELGCGLKHTLLLVDEGKVLSCGSNEKGQLGQDQSVTRPGVFPSNLCAYLINKGIHKNITSNNWLCCIVVVVCRHHQQSRRVCDHSGLLWIQSLLSSD